MGIILYCCIIFYPGLWYQRLWDPPPGWPFLFLGLVRGWGAGVSAACGFGNGLMWGCMMNVMTLGVDTRVWAQVVWADHPVLETNRRKLTGTWELLTPSWWCQQCVQPCGGIPAPINKNTVVDTCDSATLPTLCSAGPKDLSAHRTLWWLVT